MRFASVIKFIKISSLFSLVYLSPSSSMAEISLESLGPQSAMAEQGAICASFSALMEHQSLLNEDLGQLWTERRKFSGAIIRRAVELNGQETPTGEAIDALITSYTDWMVLTLTTKEDGASLSDYQADLQNLIRTNCGSLYIQADKAILRRFPNLAYLVEGPEAASASEALANQAADDKLAKQTETLLRKNIELNQQLASLKTDLEQAQQALANAEATSKAQLSNEAEPVSDSATNIAIAAPAPRPDIRPTAKPQKKVEPTATPSGDDAADASPFFAQLGSYSSNDVAQDAQTDLLARFPDLFKTLSLSIHKHQFASGKIFYRLTTNHIDRQTVTNLCDELWEARLGCLIKMKVE